MKKTFKAFVLMTFTLLIAAITVLGASASTPIPGDVNGDGKASVVDSIVLMQYLAGSDVSCVYNAMDINGDKTINKQDVGALVKFIVGIIKEANIEPACTHNGLANIPATVTCTADGSREYWQCPTCQIKFSDASATVAVTDRYLAAKAEGHKEAVLPSVAPTCTATGLIEGKHCSVCNAVLVKQEVVPAKGHTEATDAAVSATCTTTGLTEGKHCSVCNAILVKQEVVLPNGHTEVTDVAVAPKCTETGLTEGKHCSVCNEVIVAQTSVPATGHSEVTDAAVVANCTETGLTEGKHCSVCNEVIVAQTTVPAIGHTEVIDFGIKPTITDNGLTDGSHCSVCNTVIIKQEIAYATGTLGLAYELNPEKTEYTLIGIGTSTETNIIIPEYYNNLPVTKVGNDAFLGIPLDSLVVSSSVLEIDNGAFYMCNIKDITLNEGLRVIGSHAFTSLDAFVNIPSTVTHIGDTFYTYNCARSNMFSGVTFLGDCPEFTGGNPFMESYYYLYEPTAKGWPEAGGEIYTGTFYPVGWKYDPGETTFEEQQVIYNQAAVDLANTLYLSENIQWAEHMRVVTNEEDLEAFIILSNEICLGLNTTDEKILAIYNWVRNNLTYDDTYLLTDVTQCLKDKRAVCAQFAQISIQLMRLQSIPALYISGGFGNNITSIEEACTSIDYSHGWILAYNGKRWLWIDPTNGAYDFDYIDNKLYVANTVEYISDIRNKKRQYNTAMHILYTDTGMKTLAFDETHDLHIVNYIGNLSEYNGGYFINRQYTLDGQPYNNGWFEGYDGNGAYTAYCLEDGRALTDGTYLIDGKLYTFDEFGFLVE